MSDSYTRKQSYHKDQIGRLGRACADKEESMFSEFEQHEFDLWKLHEEVQAVEEAARMPESQPESSSD